MSNKEMQEMIDVILGFINGKEIQYFCRVEQDWIVSKTPTWNFEFVSYRIKPQITKRLLTPIELFERGATHIKNNDEFIFIITHFTNKYLDRSGIEYKILELHQNNFKWTSDRKTWNRFEVEVEE